MIFRLRLPHIGASPMLKHTCMIFIGDINISYVFICHKIYSMFLKKCFHNMNPQTLPVHDKGLRFPREHLRNCVQFMFITDTSRLSWGRSSHWGSNTICPKFGGHVQCFFKRGSKNITMMLRCIPRLASPMFVKRNSSVNPIGIALAMG